MKFLVVVTPPSIYHDPILLVVTTLTITDCVVYHLRFLACCSFLPPIVFPFLIWLVAVVFPNKTSSGC